MSDKKTSFFINDTEVLYDDTVDNVWPSFGVYDQEKLNKLVNDYAQKTGNFTELIKNMALDGYYAEILAMAAAFLCLNQKQQDPTETVLSMLKESLK